MGIKNDYAVFKAFYVAFFHECIRGYFPLLNSYNRNIMVRTYVVFRIRHRWFKWLSR
ncbi:hypothetical protein ALT785_470016 [Alteromonas infernus]